MRIRNWEQYQGYEKRGPRWLKLHVSLINDPAWIQLPLAARALLPVLWIVASGQGVEGTLPDDPALLAILAHVSKDEVLQALGPLATAGFIARDETVAHTAKEVSGEKRRVERETETEQTPVALSAPAPSWSREACDDWVGRFGGTAPGGRIGKALQPLVKTHGWSEVRRAWRGYLDQSEAEYASAQRFASTYGRWSGSAPPVRAGPKASVTDQNRTVLDQWERDVREGRR